MSKQRSLDFGEHPLWTDEGRRRVTSSFAEIIAAKPNLYRGLMLDVALRTLHREGKPHDPTECPLCRQGNAGEAITGKVNA